MLHCRQTTYGSFIAVNGPENRITDLFSMDRLLNGPNTNTKITGNPFDALALCPRRMDRSQGLVGDSGATDGPPALGTVLPGPGDSCGDPLFDHGTLELGEHAHHLEQSLAAWGSGINPLPVEVEMHANGL